jgi:hypothetical protein
MTEQELLRPDALFKAAQEPRAWLESAEKLYAAAELILQDQVRHEIRYFRAYDAATQEALSKACVSAEGAASAEIKADAPNYLPAQMLYAFAIENVLKGLIIAGNPALAGKHTISSEVKSHDLIKLARKASFELAVQELPVMKALSEIGVWAGRYPVAIELAKYSDLLPLDDPHRLLDYGAHHPTVRRIFNRAADALKARASQSNLRFGVVVVFAPKVN